MEHASLPESSNRERGPPFQNSTYSRERPENVCSINIPTRNFRNFLINGKRPSQRFSFSFPELRYSPLEKFAKICRIERDGINAIKFEAARTHFLGDVFI